MARLSERLAKALSGGDQSQEMVGCFPSHPARGDFDHGEIMRPVGVRGAKTWVCLTLPAIQFLSFLAF